MNEKHTSTPKQTLNSILTRRGLATAYKQMIDSAPALENIVHSLAQMIGSPGLLPGVAGEDGGLFESCLVEAINAFQSVSPGAVDSLEQRRKFMRGLLRHVHLLTQVTVVATRNGHDVASWDPLRSGPLQQWIITQGGLEHIEVLPKPISQVSEEAVRQMVAARIASLPDLEWIEGLQVHPMDTGKKAVQSKLYEVFR